MLLYLQSQTALLGNNPQLYTCSNEHSFATTTDNVTSKIFTIPPLSQYRYAAKPGNLQAKQCYPVYQWALNRKSLCLKGY
jgi:hypothetical protein